MYSLATNRIHRDPSHSLMLGAPTVRRQLPLPDDPAPITLSLTGPQWRDGPAADPPLRVGGRESILSKCSAG